MPTDEQLWYRMMSESSKKDPLIEARKKAQQEDIEAAKAEEQSFASKVGEMIMPPRPEAPQVDLARVAEGTSHIPGISYIDDEEFEPLEVKPTPQDMRHARWQQLPHNVLRDRLTPEDPEKVAQIAGIVGETAAGFTPAGVIIDIKDMAKAVETKDPILAAAAGVGLIPGIGDAAKGTFKSLKAGDRSAETVRVGRQLLEEAEDAERQWLERGTDSRYFRSWFGDSKVKDESGEPIILYHATPHDFSSFNPSKEDSFFGDSIYFSDSIDDVNANYANIGGADVQSRIDREMDQVDLFQMDDDEILQAADDLIEDPKGLTKQQYDRLKQLRKSDDTDEAIKDLIDYYNEGLVQAIAKRNVVGGANFSVMPVYTRIKNPVYLDPTGKKGTTTFNIETTFDEAGDIIDESGNGVELLETIRLKGAQFDVPDSIIDEIVSDIAESMLDYDGINAVDVDDIIRRGGEIYTGTGGYGNQQFVKEVFEEMGFDGIVANAYHYFGPKNILGARVGGMDAVTPDTYHYMVFDPKQIKSATGNRGTFDPSNPDITAAAPASLAGALDDSSVA